MRKLFKPNANIYKTHYLKQTLGQYGGALPSFQGVRYQRGYGLGSFLKGLLRSAVPLLKAGVQNIGKTALQTGVNLAGDYMSGRDLKSAVQSRALEGAQELKTKAMRGARSILNQTGKGLKRRTSSKSVIRSRAKKKKTSNAKQKPKKTKKRRKAPPKGNRKKQAAKKRKPRKKARREDIFGY